MKSTRSKTDKRKVDKSFVSEGILGYDIDNLYPQRVTDTVNASVIAVKCIDVIASFIEGDGFKDKDFYKLVVNSDGLTTDKLLRFLAKEISLRNGFAFHLNYDANFKVTEIRNVPFADPRLRDPKKEDHKNKIAVYDGWGDTSRTIKRDEICWIDVFNPDPAVIQKQVEDLIDNKSVKTIEEAWKAYKGQIYWYSAEGKNYPLAPYDAALEAIETEGAINSWKLKNAQSSFTLNHIFVYKGKFETDREREDFKNSLEQFQGPKGARTILLELGAEENKPEIVTLPQPDSKSNFYVTTEDKVQDNIRLAFGLPGVLIGQNVQGALGLSSQMTDSYAVVNALTNKHRRLVEETMKILFANFYIPQKPDQDYSIIPSSYDTGNAQQPLAIQFGVGGTTSVKEILVDPLLKPEQKINTLIILFGLTPDQANAMVNGTPIPTEEVPE